MNNIRSIKEIKLLDLSENRITNTSLQVLFNCISLLTQLQTLYMNSKIYIYIYICLYYR